jgi:hypothetical protein
MYDVCKALFFKTHFLPEVLSFFIAANLQYANPHVKRNVSTPLRQETYVLPRERMELAKRQK